jgi:hypothetical protein
LAEVPAQAANTDVVVETEAPAVSEPTVTDVVAEVPAEGATTDVVSEEAAEVKPVE